MCLDTVEREVKSSIVHSGYKRFLSGPTFESFKMKAGAKVPQDRWIKAEGPSSINANDGRKYPAYFHIYETENGTLSRTRVFFRKLKCVGKQAGEKVYIAEEMYVPSDPNGWPPIEKSAAPKDSPMKVIIEKLSSVIDDLKKTAGNA